MVRITSGPLRLIVRVPRLLALSVKEFERVLVDGLGGTARLRGATGAVVVSGVKVDTDGVAFLQDIELNTA